MNKIAPVTVIIAAGLWGIDGILLRPELYDLNVSLVVLIESSIVSILLLPVLVRNFKSLSQLTLKDWISFSLVALFGGAIGTMAITKALFFVNFVNLSVVILIQKLQPVFAMILAAILLREKLVKKFYLWASVAVSATYLMTFGFHIPDFNNGNKTLEAALFALLAAGSFGASTVFSKRALRKVSFELGTYLRFSISMLVMVIFFSVFSEPGSVTKLTMHHFYIFLIIAFTTGGPAIFLYYYGLKRITASVATICELAFPLTAIVLEYIIHGNILSVFQWIGVVVLMFSIFKVSRIDAFKHAS